MFSLIQNLFELASYPESKIAIHSEPDTAKSTKIQSIGISVRTVKVELVRFYFREHCQFLVLVHLEEGSAVIVHNDDVVSYDYEVGLMIAKMIEKELQVIVDKVKMKVLDAMTFDLMASDAIAHSESRLNQKIADGFVRTSSLGTYDDAESLLAQLKQVHHE